VYGHNVSTFRFRYVEKYGNENNKSVGIIEFRWSGVARGQVVGGEKKKI